MNRSDVQAWLDRYVEAWRANEREPIEQLFTEDAVYGYRPWDSEKHTVTGHDAIVASWLDEPDAPGSWDARYETWAVDGDRAVAVGWSRKPRVYRRPVYDEILERAHEPRRFIQVLAGPRQAGKTTLARQVMDAIGMPGHFASAG